VGILAKKGSYIYLLDARTVHNVQLIIYTNKCTLY